MIKRLIARRVLIEIHELPRMEGVTLSRDFAEDSIDLKGLSEMMEDGQSLIKERPEVSITYILRTTTRDSRRMFLVMPASLFEFSRTSAMQESVAPMRVTAHGVPARFMADGTATPMRFYNPPSGCGEPVFADTRMCLSR